MYCFVFIILSKFCKYAINLCVLLRDIIISKCFVFLFQKDVFHLCKTRVAYTSGLLIALGSGEALGKLVQIEMVTAGFPHF